MAAVLAVRRGPPTVESISFSAYFQYRRSVDNVKQRSVKLIRGKIIFYGIAAVRGFRIARRIKGRSLNSRKIIIPSVILPAARHPPGNIIGQNAVKHGNVPAVRCGYNRGKQVFRRRNGKANVSVAAEFRRQSALNVFLDRVGSHRYRYFQNQLVYGRNPLCVKHKIARLSRYACQSLSRAVGTFIPAAELVPAFNGHGQRRIVSVAVRRQRRYGIAAVNDISYRVYVKRKLRHNRTSAAVLLGGNNRVYSA